MVNFITTFQSCIPPMGAPLKYSLFKILYVKIPFQTSPYVCLQQYKQCVLQLSNGIFYYISILNGYIVHHFGGPLMDDKNLTIQAQVVKALFALQTLDIVFKHCFINIVEVCPCLIFFTQFFVELIKPFHSILIPFIFSPLELFKC